MLESPSQPLPSPPVRFDDVTAWTSWALNLLGEVSSAFAAWHDTWRWEYVPVYNQPDPDAFIYLDRESRVLGHRPELRIPTPPSGIIAAPVSLDHLSAAVQRLSGSGAWQFESSKEAREVAKELLAIGQAISFRRFTSIDWNRIEELFRLIKLASRNPSFVSPPNVKNPSGRPRKIQTDPELDKKIAEAWQTGCYKTFDELAQALGMRRLEVKQAYDRHRKREIIPEPARVKPKV